MSDVSASEMRDNLERTDIAAVVDNQWTEVDARKLVAEPNHNSSAAATGEARSEGSKVSISNRGTAPSGKGVRIAIQSKGRVLLFDAFDLVAVEAQGNYVLLRRQTCSHLIRRSISKIEETLGQYGFVRIHRSVLINSVHVEEVRSLPTGEYGVHIRSGKAYNVGRRYTSNLRLLAEAWIDTDA
jgi:DNA-binding LytR/AlgR family response regulator